MLIGTVRLLHLVAITGGNLGRSVTPTRKHLIRREVRPPANLSPETIPSARAGSTSGIRFAVKVLCQKPVAPRIRGALAMNNPDEFDEHLTELRTQVCSHCIARLPNAPPCGPLGKGCGIEQHLPELVAICRTTNSALIDPYIQKLHDTICSQCAFKDKPDCPCPLDYLLQLAVEAVETVERRRAARGANRPTTNTRLFRETS